jgi:hypothetical protein
MQFITHQYHLDALPESPLKNHLIARYDDLVETLDDLSPIFVIVEEDDDIIGPDYAFVSGNGLLGDGDTLVSYETVIHLPDLNMYELLFLVKGEDGYWIYAGIEV